jgi:dTMP kinase
LTTVCRRPGLLITFEGGEGSGKTTQARLLAEWLESRGAKVVRARDPGTTAVGEAIRDVLLNPASTPMAALTELLLYAAARAQLVEEVIEPALAAGALVVVDRFEDSTYAYQGAARGLGSGLVSRVADVATRGLRPDLTVLVDLGPDEGRQRWQADAQRGGADRLEGENAAFHERVREAYLARAKAEPERFLVLDGRGLPMTIHDAVRRRVLALLEPALLERQ